MNISFDNIISVSVGIGICAVGVVGGLFYTIYSKQGGDEVSTIFTRAENEHINHFRAVIEAKSTSLEFFNKHTLWIVEKFDKIRDMGVFEYCIHHKYETTQFIFHRTPFSYVLEDHGYLSLDQLYAINNSMSICVEHGAVVGLTGLVSSLGCCSCFLHSSICPDFLYNYLTHVPLTRGTVTGVCIQAGIIDDLTHYQELVHKSLTKMYCIMETSREGQNVCRESMQTLQQYAKSINVPVTDLLLWDEVRQTNLTFKSYFDDTANHYYKLVLVDKSLTKQFQEFSPGIKSLSLRKPI